MAHNTIDLRGFRVEDAFPAIEQFFDGLSNRSSVGFILHGHGTGALKVGVRQWLSSSSYVRDFRPANIEEGGDALTVVRFRE
jgi:DNA mismatch repair protein MutS2